MILVVGATGMVGTQICRRLAARGLPTRALVRPTSDPAKVEALRDLHAEIVQGDLRDPASLAEACRGVTAVICTVSSMPFSYEAGKNDISTTDLDGVVHLIDAAKAAGVGHFVYTSFSANIDVECPLRDAKRTVEAYLKISGLRYTILRPSCFMEVWLSPATGFDPLAGRITVYGEGRNPISWIAVADVADFAVAALDAPGARDATLEMGGPEALSPRQVIALFERLSGRSFTVEYIPAETLRASQEAVSDQMGRSFIAIQRAYANGDAIDVRPALAAVPLKLTSVEDYAATVLGVAPVLV